MLRLSGPWDRIARLRCLDPARRRRDERRDDTFTILVTRVHKCLTDELKETRYNDVDNMPTERSMISASDPSPRKWSIRCRLKPGDIGHLARLHGILYAKECGYDHTFEAYVAEGLAEFVKSTSPDRNRIWLAERNDQIVGSIAIVGSSKLEAQLRWFLVHPDCRGLGLGRELMNEALSFCREMKYGSVFLWTTSELVAARHLYTSVGFRKTGEKTHEIWGKEVTEERYDLQL